MYTAKLTGVIDANSGFIQVELLDKDKVYARPVFSFPLIAIITKDWLDAYKDRFMAVVDYLGTGKESLVMVGIIPLVNKTLPAEGYTNNYFLYGKDFRVWLDEVNNKCIIDVLNGGEILLGDKSVTEPGVLGDKNAAALKDISDRLNNIYSAIQNATVTPQDGGASFKAALLASLGADMTTISTFEQNLINPTKSGTVKLK